MIKIIGAKLSNVKCAIYICKYMRLKNQLEFILKNQKVSTPENIEKLYELPTCAELQIKNLLE